MDTRHVDFLVIGAGPAGLQLGYFLNEHQRDYLILESSDKAGAFFETYPRHRKLISVNKVHTGYDDPEVNMRWDWNSLISDNPELLFKNYTKRYFPDAGDIVRYSKDFAEQHHLRIQYNETVREISKDAQFQVETENGTRYTCNVLIIATGLHKPFIPAIPGAELAEVYCDVDVNPDSFINQRVLIVGKGNSAFETADNLIETAALIHVASPNPLKMAWKTHYVGHLRAVNNNFLDTYQLKSQNAMLDATIEEIARCPDTGHYRVKFAYTHAGGESETLEYDRVILATGFRFDTSIFADSCRPALAICDRFPAQTPVWESTNVSDMFFAGTLMQMRDFKKYMSGFIHGFRYNVRTLSRVLESRYSNKPLPSCTYAGTSADICAAILERMARNSGLWQQPGYLADLIELHPSGASCTYVEELPMDYIRESILRPGVHSFVVSMEFGDSEAPDPFNVVRIARDNIVRSHESTFLHPVIRHFDGAVLVEEHHIIEDLAAEWREPEHTEPLTMFVDAQLAEIATARSATAPMEVAAQAQA